MEKSFLKKNISIRYFLFPLILIICYFLASYHFISGAPEKSGFIILKKHGFSFNETFVNYNSVVGLPYIVSKTKYPLTVKALQDARYIETDEDREERLRLELQLRLEENQQKIYKNIKEEQEKIYKETLEQMKKLGN